MPGSMTDGDPVAMMAERELRYFTIPGCKGEEWDAALHGLEVKAEDCGSGDVTEVSWTPGRYTYVAGASGNQFSFDVPESRNQSWPNMHVLKGIHQFLNEVLDA